MMKVRRWIAVSFIVLLACTESTAPLPSSAFVSVAASIGHTCAVQVSGTAYCWGQGADGQLGSGFTSSASPVSVYGDLVFDEVATGGAHTCGATPGGAVFCWGRNDHGQLGNATIQMRPPYQGSPTPVAVTAPSLFRDLTAALDHACAVGTDSLTYCWGEGADGVLGMGDSLDHTFPSPIAGGAQWATVATGRTHTCGLLVDGAAYCWGANTHGELGDSSTSPAAVPVAVKTALRFQAITTGEVHTCALGLDDLAYCWGAGAAGMLGNDDTLDVHQPVPVSGARAYAVISAGGFHTCAVTDDGASFCWGVNDAGQLGSQVNDGVCSFPCARTPSAVPGGFRFKQISGGFRYNCAVSFDGAVYCWGLNTFWQLGTDSVSASATPLRVPNPT